MSRILIFALLLLPLNSCARSNSTEEASSTRAVPRVLLIGDSISMGYTPFVAEMLAGQAYVEHPEDNCGPTIRGLERLDAWLGEEAWDVIHFNFGLHDLKHIDSEGKIASPDQGERQVPIDEYEKNLQTLVDRLKKTKAKLIWCSTTPVPEGAGGRIAGDEIRYNEVAAKIMKAEGIPINDLHAFAAERLETIQKKANVHFTDDGSSVLAEEVTRHVRKALKLKAK